MISIVISREGPEHFFFSLFPYCNFITVISAFSRAEQTSEGTDLASVIVLLFYFFNPRKRTSVATNVAIRVFFYSDIIWLAIWAVLKDFSF